MSGLTAQIYYSLTNNVYKNINTNMRLISCIYIYYVQQNTYWFCVDNP